MARRVGPRPRIARRLRPAVGHGRPRRPAPRSAAVRLGRLRELPVIDATPDELMIAAAAAELAGVRTVFVGIGLPNAAANPAPQSLAPPRELMYGSASG